MSNSAIIVSATERVGFIGQTGSGKTELARWLLDQGRIERFWFVDLKWSPANSAWARARGIPILSTPEPSETPALLRCPDHLEAPEFVDQLGRWALRQGNRLLVLDDVQDACSQSTTPRGLQMALQKGRELQVGVWYTTTRPTGISNYLLESAGRFFIFRLTLPDDRRKLAGVVGPGIAETANTLDLFHWIHARVGETEAAVVVPPVRLQGFPLRPAIAP